MLKNLKQQIINKITVNNYSEAADLLRTYLKIDCGVENFLWGLTQLAICNTELDLLEAANKSLNDASSVINQFGTTYFSDNIIAEYYFAVALHLTRQGDYCMARYWLTLAAMLAKDTLKINVNSLLDKIELSSYNKDQALLERSFKNGKASM